MRRNTVQKENKQKINKMNKSKLTEFIKQLEVKKATESKVYKHATKHYSVTYE